jgi:hypothetical protein
VTETAAAPSELAVKHFQDMLAFETDLPADTSSCEQPDSLWWFESIKQARLVARPAL